MQSELIEEDAKYLRLLHKGAALRGRLGEIWRDYGSYVGAATAVRDALLQEHFSASTMEWRGVNVMTMHRSKGKEFDEVLSTKEAHQGRIVRANASDYRSCSGTVSAKGGSDESCKSDNDPKPQERYVRVSLGSASVQDGR